MKDEKSAENEDNVLGKVVGLIFATLLLGTIMSGKGISDKFDNFLSLADPGLLESSEVATSNPSPNGVSFINFMFPSGTLKINKNIYSKGGIAVRAIPGGQILGRQIIRAKGIIIGGPETKFKKKWWRVDFEEAPDGWVLGDNITHNMGWFSALNIIPTTLKILRPFLILLSIIVSVFIFLVFIKKHDLNKINKNKTEFMEGHNRVKSRYAKKDNFNEGGVENGNTILGNLPTGKDTPKTKDVHNKKWEKIQSLMNSHSVNDWRQAILEADIILEEMLDKMGYKGESAGDKLKQVEKSDFLTINKAWEAHKIRNKIAHVGSSYALSRDMAEDTIKLYTQVFEEFYFI